MTGAEKREAQADAGSRAKMVVRTSYKVGWRKDHKILQNDLSRISPTASNADRLKKQTDESINTAHPSVVSCSKGFGERGLFLKKPPLPLHILSLHTITKPYTRQTTVGEQAGSRWSLTAIGSYFRMRTN